MHTDLKIQTLIEKHGLEGYAVWNLCLEMVGKEGMRGRIDGRLRWIEALLKVDTRLVEGRLKEIINSLAEIGLVCPKALKYGNLLIPKFTKRADDYTKRLLRIKTEGSTDNIPLHYNTLHNITKQYITLQGLDEVVKDNKQIYSTILKTNCKAIKTLVLLAGGEELAIRATKYVADLARNKGWSEWTMQAVVNHYPEFLKHKRPEPESINKEGQEKVKDLTKGIGKDI